METPIRAELTQVTLSAQVLTIPTFKASLGKIMVGFTFDDYEGEYVVTPSMEQQELKTTYKTTTHDIVVNPIPHYEVSNESGVTFIIG